MKNKTTINYFTSFIAYGLSFVSNLLVYYLISNLFKGKSFEEYTLSKRLISLIIIPLMLGLGVSLPREIAFRNSRNDNQDDIQYLYSGLFMVFVLNVILFTFSCFFRNRLSIVFYGNISFVPILISTLFALFGLSLYSVLFAYLRGKMYIFEANVLTIINAIIPITAYLFSENVEQFWALNGLLSLLIYFICLYFIISFKEKKRFFKDIVFIKIQKASSVLLKYGLKRIPGDWALDGLLSVPVFLSVHLYDSQLASYLSFSGTLVGMVGTVLTPINLILLPYSASMISGKKFNDLRMHVKKICLIFLPCIFVGGLIILIFREYFLFLYLNIRDLTAHTTLGILSFSLLPFSLYSIFRSTIDAAFDAPINSINCLFSLVISVVVIISGFFLKIPYSTSYAILASYIYLGTASYISYERIFKNI